MLQQGNAIRSLNIPHRLPCIPGSPVLEVVYFACGGACATLDVSRCQPTDGDVSPCSQRAEYEHH